MRRYPDPLPDWARDSFLNPEQVAELFQVPLRTIWKMARAGTIPAMKFGHTWRFRETDLRVWIDKQYARSVSKDLAEVPDPEFVEIQKKAREILHCLQNERR